MTLSSFNLQNKGAITAGLLLIAISFILVIYGILFLLTNQLSLTYRQGSYDSALYLAEAGIEYYRWHLAHAPNDFTSGQGEHDFKDPQGEIIGKFNLEIETPTNGSSIVTIRSTGWLNNYPEAKRTIRVQYGIPSLTKYSFLSNASSWYGSGITVHGEIHSNNGIRMDGINTSIVSSVQKEYQCGTETGCSPTQKKPGVWGSGPNFDLWRFPSTPVDFDSVFFDLAEMKNSAISHGLYLNKSGAQGYHLVFKANGTFDVYKVNQTDSFHAYTTHEGCRRLYLNIRTQNFIRNYTVAQKPIIFVEDNTWVDGTVNGKVT
ncbi:hypothetical protein GYA19_05960, partial [Candidatus Beckwithbacteria bacterium]|nr:hypothetical protein [Candidatus Beckwithbacteria bacterium]